MIQPTLLRDWEGSDVAGWYMSEKLDGWRMLWDGENFISRQGKIFDAPEWFKNGMPNKVLDGELFLGRGMFNGIQAAMSGGWSGLEFRIFDAPEIKGDYKKRLRSYRLGKKPAHIRLVGHTLCEGIEHMMEYAAEIVTNGGEGVVLRDPRAIYKAGRTSDVLRWVPQDPALNRQRLSLGSASTKCTATVPV